MPFSGRAVPRPVRCARRSAAWICSSRTVRRPARRSSPRAFRRRGCVRGAPRSRAQRRRRLPGCLAHGSCSQAACIPRGAPTCCSTRSRSSPTPQRRTCSAPERCCPNCEAARRAWASTGRFASRDGATVPRAGSPARRYASCRRASAWSQAAVLAMSLGVPVVGTAVEGLPDVLGDRRGVLVPADDPAALAGAIHGVLSGRIRTDARAARRYARMFSPRLVAARYASAYHELCGPRDTIRTAAVA